MTETPAPPAHLDTVAVEKWTELLPTLPDTEPVTLDALANYAAAWSRMIDAERKVAELGVVVRGSGGTASVSPYLIVAQQERRAVRQWGERLTGRKAASAPTGETSAVVPASPSGRRGGRDQR